MKLPELKELAKQMGLRGTSTMRKPELLATLQAARNGGEAPAGVTVRAPRSRKTEAAAPVESAPASDAASKGKQTPEQTSEQAPDNESHAHDRAQEHTPVEPAVEEPVKSAGHDVSGPMANVDFPPVDRPVRKKRRRDDAQTDASASQIDPSDLLESLDLDGDAKREPSRTIERATGRRHVIDENGDEIIVANVRRRRRPEPREEREQEVVRDLDDILATLPGQRADRVMDDEPRRMRADRADRGDRQDRADRSDRGRDDRASRRDERDDRMDRRGRRLRGRNRDMDERDDRASRRDDHRDDHADVRESSRAADRREEANDLVPVAGIVDVLDSYAFVRTSGYLPGPNDVYVSMGQVKKYGLRKGDAVHGAIRAPREGDRRNQRQKFVPLLSIDSVNGMSVEESLNRPQFNKLTPLYPQERLKQETTPNKLTGRIMDIVAPIGKGQRGLIVSPPKAGKTITLQNIANAITTNNPEVHLMVVLVDERPEEVTDMERTVQGEVISSTFDRPASDHTTVAELAIERAKRLVELGQDVVVLLDSMTRLARAYNIAAPASGRILSGGVDAQALYPPKKFFGAARNIENGGSLTIISSALVETGSKMDEVIFEEFKGTGNMELKLSRELADKRLFPAIDINASGTRREELITNPQELPIIYRLRRLFGGMEPEQAYQTLVPRLKKAPTNRDFLAAIVQQQGGGAVNGN